MADGPIQIVLNADRFREKKITQQGGGAGKDFFRDNDDDFIAHRDSISESLRAVLRRRAQERLIHVVVQMRPDALAKSHRPFAKLFTAARGSHVGTGHYGELIFATSAAQLQDVIALIQAAERDVAWKRGRDEILRYSPTFMRSETSAIESVREWNSSQERDFSIEDAEVWVGTGAQSRLQVDTFALAKREPMRSTALQLFDALFQAAGSVPELVRINVPPELAMIRSKPELGQKQSTPIETGADRHDADPVRAVDLREQIANLEASAIVQRVRLEERLGPVDEFPDASDHESVANEFVNFTGVDAALKRGIVGVIDGGVAGPMGSMASIVGTVDLLAQEHRSVDGANHASAVASLVTMGSSFNPLFLRSDENCDVFDLGLFPKTENMADYYGSLDDFFDELREDVGRARREFGVRVFNLSWNLRRPPITGSYGIAAQRLDALALEEDVIFVVSAGNLPRSGQRSEWPASSSDALAMLALGGTPDGISSPAESIANLGVGAVNPPGLVFEIEGAPTRYTRRGGRVPSALKPDLAAPGGAAPDSLRADTGLRAMNSFGNVGPVRGTSFAAPLAARYLASLDAAIAGDVPRETLIALAIHHSRAPQVLNNKSLARVGGSFVGHGVPISVEDTLEGNPHGMTILLNDRIKPGRRVEFPFTWPRSLASVDGSCRGRLRLTIVARPQLDFTHGQEMVRVNLDAAVKQANAKGRFSRKTQPTHQFFSGFSYANERTLATELGKWYPIKSYERSMPRGNGASTDWQLEIDYLTRAGESPPTDGVEFAVIMTIDDPVGEAPVFDEMRASLISIGVQLNELRTAINVSLPV